jgi:hypothetical protein
MEVHDSEVDPRAMRERRIETEAGTSSWQGQKGNEKEKKNK